MTTFAPMREEVFGEFVEVTIETYAQDKVTASRWRDAQALGLVKPEFLWSALDCPSGFAILPVPVPVPVGRAIVLGELCASTGGRVSVGQGCMVTAWPLWVEGRKRCAASAIFLEAGALMALARAVWIEVPHSPWKAA